MINQSIQTLKKEIEKAALQSGRSYEDITLIAVTKTRTVEEMKAVEALGITHFGENKVQELQSKYDYFDKNIYWHMIGHLQRNKVKYIIDKASLIHSVDSIRLAEIIDQEAAKKEMTAKILLQVNVANEGTKFGLHIDEVQSVVQEITSFKNIQVHGLMTVAPFTDKPEENREYFRKLKQLSVDINNQKLDNIFMNILSMGMTNDFIVAIEEGATMVRVGTGIFGERDYQ